ncbi:interferon-induced GTP-binding protein Mx1-like [Scyliorhinus canicula]|uniref:interferon-induced GTP-binding protein Mx1-like n=1 Tax=Scyliorhinus canicula TaxID=7830 RepID=UPI0018F7286E|nr:interferon-induced GTP-binding protein Mx1-like [Scyliorhinus canicula]XP_038657395.1 interferon-induced GTP-binding protein Mx1-like [Scyliorhinus canicula]
MPWTMLDDEDQREDFVPSADSQLQSRTNIKTHTPTMDAVLYNHYEEKVRPCIDLIDSLRALGVDQDLSLPAIAVIGDQSSGKSSVLEALSGVALPRGSGIVTRCPLELKLKKTKTAKNWKGRISYKNFSKELSDPSEVEKEIVKAQNTMAGKDLGISSELISLEVESNISPDLTLIDLPGIARVAVGNQPQDIGEQIKQLISSYINEDKTINLVVIPCNVDIATTEALKMAQEADPSGGRTLGILTKPDLVDKGTEDSILKIMRNEVVALNKGYMVVKCRGQQDINEQLTLAEALQREKAFFKQNEFFRTLLEEKVATVQCVAARLTTELVSQIRKTLPTIEREVRCKIAETSRELEMLGTGVPDDDEDRIPFLIDKIRAYTEDLFSLTIGEYSKEYDDDMKLYTVVRKSFGKWHDLLDADQTEFKDIMSDKVSEYTEKSRGRELPGFTNYRIFESLAKNQIVKLESPSLCMLKEIADQVQSVFNDLALQHFPGLPNLMKSIKSKIDDIRQAQELEAEEMLKTLFKMEKMVYSQDIIYCNKLNQIQTEYEVPEDHSQKLISMNTDITAMSIHLETYYMIASNRLADMVPMVLRFYLLQEYASKLQRNMLQLLQGKERMDELLVEEEDVFEKRKFLNCRLKRLRKARQILTMC